MKPTPHHCLPEFIHYFMLYPPEPHKSLLFLSYPGRCRLRAFALALPSAQKTPPRYLCNSQPHHSQAFAQIRPSQEAFPDHPILWCKNCPPLSIFPILLGCVPFFSIALNTSIIYTLFSDISHQNISSTVQGFCLFFFFKLLYLQRLEYLTNSKHPIFVK